VLAFTGVVVFGLIVGAIVWRAAASPHYYSRTVSLAVVALPDPEHAWVAGDIWTDGGHTIAGGTIYATADGGAGWREQELSTRWSDPSGVAFANAKCGWLVGSAQAVGDTLPSDENMLLATTDGGLTWQKQSCRAKGYVFTGVACVSASHAWVVGGDMGSGGAVFATRDGGAHWQRQYVTKAGDLWGIAFADARHGWAVGDGVILATADGGASWRQHLVKGCFLSSVAGGDALSAWAVGSGANRDVILATTDGGTSWQVQHTGTGPDAKGESGYSGVAFADARRGWVVGRDGTILTTTDAGRTWKPQRSGTKLDLDGVAFADTSHGIVVGARVEGDDPLAGKLDGSIILRTSDGGTAWTR